MKQNPKSEIRNPKWTGFTLVEAVMSMLIVSLLLVAAMRATGAATLTQYKASQRLTARLLADGMINDICCLSYEDPNVTPVFGPEPGESSTSKANWNDIDDFNGWTESPPAERDGTVMPDLNGWRRSVAVDWIDPSDLSQVRSSETGLKRITVTVACKNVVIATRVALRSRSNY